MSPNEIYHLVHVLVHEVLWNGGLNITGASGLYDLTRNVNVLRMIGAAGHAAILNRARTMTRDEFEEAWFASRTENVQTLLESFRREFIEHIASNQPAD